jgi:hypothetical protein
MGLSLGFCCCAPGGCVDGFPSDFSETFASFVAGNYRQVTSGGGSLVTSGGTADITTGNGLNYQYYLIKDVSPEVLTDNAVEISVDLIDFISTSPPTFSGIGIVYGKYNSNSSSPGSPAFGAFYNKNANNNLNHSRPGSANQIATGRTPAGKKLTLRVAIFTDGHWRSELLENGGSITESFSTTPLVGVTNLCGRSVAIALNRNLNNALDFRFDNWNVTFGTEAEIFGGFSIKYPRPYSNTATPPSAGFDWRIETGSAVSIAATIEDGVAPYVCSVLSGSLPPGCTLAAGTGLITDTIPILGPSSSGSCVIKCVDAESDEAVTARYNWQYIGEDGDIWSSPTFFVSPDDGGGFEPLNLIFGS